LKSIIRKRGKKRKEEEKRGKKRKEEGRGRGKREEEERRGKMREEKGVGWIQYLCHSKKDPTNS
jgi:hypothetical protein